MGCCGKSRGGVVSGNRNLANLASAIEGLGGGGFSEGDGTEWGTIYSGSTAVKIASLEDFYALGENNSNITINGKSCAKTLVTKFTFGKNPVYAPAYFLANCSNLTTVQYVENLVGCGDQFCLSCGALDCPLEFNNLFVVGNQFLYSCAKLNNVISFPNLVECGATFMDGCASFNQNLTLPSSLRKIGASFLHLLRNYTSTITINTTALPRESSVSATVDALYSLTTVLNTDKSYVSGIKITGTGASIWKSSLPDMAMTGSYRKLIVV